MQTFAQKDQQEQQTADSNNSIEQVESAPEHIMEYHVGLVWA